MNNLALILVLASCTTHAAWNLMCKKSSKTPAFFWMASATVLVAATPAFFLLGGARFLGAVPPRFWLYLAMSGAFMCGYFACLAAAYRHGDISVVYPLIRSTPIFVLLLAGLLLGQKPSWLAVAGIVLVVVGCFVLPLKRLKFGPEGINRNTYFNRASLWALGAALCSSGYTLTDDVVMDTINRLEELRFAEGLRGAFYYEYLQYAAITIGLLPVSLLFDRPAGLRRALGTEKRSAAAVGALIFVTYLLVLWAYANASMVAYVAGLRQMSIVLGVLGGVLLFKEPGGRTRILAAAVIVAGLVLIGFAG